MKKTIITAIAAAVLIGGGLSACDTTPAPKPATTQPAKATGDDYRTYLEQRALGGQTLDQACIDGVSWACNIEGFEPVGPGQLVVKVRALEAGQDGDQSARAIYQQLTLADPDRFPDLYRVQLQSLRGAQLGAYTDTSR